VEATTVNREMRIGKLGIGNPGDRKFDISPGGLSGGGVILAKPDRVRRQHDADAPAADDRAQETVDGFAASTAHAFNNILAGILGNLQLIERGTKTDRQVQRLVRAAIAAARRGNDLTMLLNAFAHRRDPTPGPCDIDAVVAGMDKTLRRAAGKKVKIDRVLAGNLPQIETDPDLLQAAILNLAINAREAMPDGGTMTVRTALFSGDDAVAARHLPSDGDSYACICVADTGCGIPPGDVERIGEPFFTTKPSGRNAGLGLCMVRGFVERSGGYLVVNSEEGHGSAFRIYLPIGNG